MIKSCGLDHDIILRQDGQKIVIEPAKPYNPREGWEEQIAFYVAKYGADEEMILDDFENEFEIEDWTWEDT